MIHLGLCGWTIAMREYFERFPVVEVQQTFYEPPAERTLLRWRESAPPGFEFTLKAWQLITHETTSSTYRRLRRPLTPEERAGVGAFRDSPIVDEAWAKTRRCADILRATAVLFQCPASFRPTDVNLERLRKFFTSRERGALRFLFEPRGAWPEDVLRTLCRTLDLVHVVDPFVDETVTPEQTYYRLHGIGGSRHVYSDAELRRLVELVRDRSEPYVLFNNLPREGDSERFRRIAGRDGLAQ